MRFLRGFFRFYRRIRQRYRWLHIHPVFQTPGRRLQRLRLVLQKGLAGRSHSQGRKRNPFHRQRLQRQVHYSGWRQGQRMSFIFGYEATFLACDFSHGEKPEFPVGISERTIPLSIISLRLSHKTDYSHICSRVFHIFEYCSLFTAA